MPPTVYISLWNDKNCLYFNHFPNMLKILQYIILGDQFYDMQIDTELKSLP